MEAQISVLLNFLKREFTSKHKQSFLGSATCTEVGLQTS